MIIVDQVPFKKWLELNASDETRKKIMVQKFEDIFDEVGFEEAARILNFIIGGLGLNKPTEYDIQIISIDGKLNKIKLYDKNKKSS